MKKNVLIIDDDLSVCREIKYALQNPTTYVYYACSVYDGIRRFMESEYCLVIMDVVLAEADGQELIKMMRRTKITPILILSSKKGRESRLAAYNAGAHAYLEKPYELEECLAQAEALMELYIGLKPSHDHCYTLAFGMDLMIDPEKRIVTLKGNTLNLTPKEFELLFCLARHAGQVLSREQLYSQVWNSENSFNIDETVKSHIKALRRKLTPANREYIKNVWGIGYRFLIE
ncbi:response regulator transcription factor [Hungatella effluvii]|uniref:response regulator transcription factor n=1 Tax=Hungatella effluvii TaxID=1096246 RepID=UPI0022E616B4|nr:response regulator transcription factor [Hungatella effluvii]